MSELVSKAGKHKKFGMQVGSLGFILDPVTTHLQIGIVPGLDILGIHQSVGGKDEILLSGK